MKHSAETHQDQLSNLIFYPILISLTLVAAALRLYQLGRWSLWVDELTTLQHAANIVRRISPGTFLFGFLYGQSLSTILTGMAVHLWGTTEWAARIVPAVTGILTVPVSGIMLRRWLGGKVALLTSLFITLSVWHIYWSQNSRYLVMQLLIYTLLFLLIYHCWHLRQYYYLLAIGPLLILLYLERLTGLAFVLIVVTIYFLTWLVGQYKGQLRSIATGRNIFLLTMPVIIFAGVFAWRVWQHSNSWLLLMERRNHTILSIVGEYSLSIRPLLFLLGVAGLVYVWRHYNKEHILFLFSFAGVVPLFLIMSASFVLFTTSRYVFPAFIFWLALAALVVVQMLDSRQHLLRLAGIVLLAIILADSANQLWRYHMYQGHGFRPDWKGAYAHVNSQMSPDDIVVTVNWRQPLADYYLSDNLPVFEERDLLNTGVLSLDTDLPFAGGGVVWFVLLEGRIGSDLQAWLTRYRPQLVYETVEIQVYRYDPE